MVLPVCCTDRLNSPWLQESCDSDEIDLVMAVRPWIWGPGDAITETEYLTAKLGKVPSRGEVIALIGRVGRVLGKCHDAWPTSSESVIALEKHGGRSADGGKT